MKINESEMNGERVIIGLSYTIQDSISDAKKICYKRIKTEKIEHSSVKCFI